MRTTIRILPLAAIVFLASGSPLIGQFESVSLRPAVCDDPVVPNLPGVTARAETLGGWSIGPDGHVIGEVDLRGGDVTSADDLAFMLVNPDGSLEIAIRQGDAAGGGTFDIEVEEPLVAAGGKVAIRARIIGPTPAGAILAGTAGGLVTVAVTGEEAPGFDADTVIENLGDLRMNAAGRIAFIAGVRKESNSDTAIYAAAGGGAVLAVRTDQNYPDLPPAPDPFNQGVESVFSALGSPLINDLGDILFRANINDGPGGISFGNSVWRVTNAGGLTEIVRERTEIGAFTATGVFDPLSFAADFAALRIRVSGDGVNSSNDDCFWIANGTSLTLVAREGDAAPVGGGAEAANFTDNIKLAVATDGTGVLSAVLSNGKFGVWKVSGGLAHLASVGSDVPEVPGNTWLSIIEVCMNPNGVIAMAATHSGAGGGGAGIWVTDDDGQLRRVVNRGDFFELPGGGQKSTGTPEIFPGYSLDYIPNGVDGRSRPFNALNQILLDWNFACAAIADLGVPAAPGSITGQVRLDLEGNGDFNDPENGFGDVTLRLFDNDGGGQPAGPQRGTANAHDTTGNYEFEGVDAGAYVVVAELGAASVEAGFSFSAPESGIRLAEVTAGGTTPGIDFLCTPMATGVTAAVTMHRIDEASADNWVGERTNPIEPSADRTKLGSTKTEISEGLVADGLSPLVFKISSDRITEDTDILWTCEPKVAGQDFVDGGILSKMKHLRGAAWQSANNGGGNLVTLSPGDGGFVQLGAIDSWELDLSSVGEPELTYVFKLVEPGQGGAELQSMEFKIRRPPVILIASDPSERWGDTFLAEFHNGRHPEFVFDTATASGSLEARIRGFLESRRSSGWAVIRADLLTHGLGGLYARLLCLERLSPIEFRATADAFRGYFHRVITIGSPHLLLQGELQMYVRELEKALAKLPAGGYPNFIPETISRIPAWSRGIDVLDDNREDITVRTLAFGSVLAPSENVDFHLIATQVDAEKSLAFDYMHLLQPAVSQPGVSRLDLITQGVSDGVSSVNNTLLGGARLGSGRTWILPPDYAAHGDAGLFDFGFAPRQTHSAKVGEIAAAALESAVESDFIPAPEMSDKLILEITGGVRVRVEAEVRSALIATLFDILRLQNANGGPQPRDNHNSETFTFEVAAIPGEPIAGDPSWWAEAHGPDGATIEGLEVRRIPGDPARVEVEVAESVLGDVVLFGSFASQNNGIVFSTPVLVTSQLPAVGKGAPDLELGSDTLEVGAVVGPVVYDNYNDGARLRRWLTAADITVSSTNPGVVDLSDKMNWVAITPGRTTITVGFDGTSAQIDVTVVDSFPPLNHQQWLGEFFSPAEIADRAITGDAVDLDGDGLNTILERISGGDPRVPNPDHLPRVTTLQIGGPEQMAIRMRVSNRLLGESVVAQVSPDLANWSELPFGRPELLTEVDFGPFTDFWFDAGTPAAGDLYYRLAIIPDGG